MIKLKEKIIQCFDKGSATYDGAADVQVIAARHLREKLRSVCAEKIIEIGCGTGLFTEQMVEQFPHAKIVITDIAPNMVNVAAQRFQSHATVQAVCMDGENLTLDDHYDLFVSSMALHWFTQFDISMKKIMNFLKPKKQFSFAFLGDNSLREWHVLCAKNNLPIGKSDFPSVAALRAVCPDVEIQVETVVQHYPSVRVFLKTMKQLGAHATHLEYTRLSMKQLRSLIRIHDAPFQLSYEVIYGTYIKP